ncbi:histidyl-tRNA synthetase [Thermosporothrix hazakensis]|uniref:Histidine--tRNA ligase n=1 Tax=Thermosporothrix hazakensis TaxID=644383 RepID=A0A326U8K6_THEHA|nr:HisS family protein [Thermosporothrix hazakensis]PZW32061.1 histidyl-tRNA synthetase [Thermosporothrix hazakensis]
MRKRVERLRGMYDLLPDVYQQQQWVIGKLGSLLAQAGYAHVDSPLLERSDLFHVSFGQELWQNLYAFRLHQRDLCLRPEFTASICRLYLDHYQQQALPLRFQYVGPVFRYEAPGRSRYRQHTQLGVELFGGSAPVADAEILQLACEILHALDIRQYRLELGHIAVASGFIHRLHLDSHAAHLLLSLMEQINRSPQGERNVQARLEELYPASSGGATPSSTNGEIEERYISSLLSGISISFGDDDARREVIERFLWKMGRSQQRRQIMGALEFLKALHAVSGPPPEVFGRLRELLDRYDLDPAPLAELQQLVQVVSQCGVPAEQIILNLSLGRGVNYYTGLVFEIHAQDVAGFDSQLCGGGRYDRLVRAVGGSRDVNACGFAFGVERLLNYVPKTSIPTQKQVQAMVIPVSGQDVPYALHVAQLLRSMEVGAEVDVSGHGVGSGLRQASRKELSLALIVGEDERAQEAVTVRHLATGTEQVVPLATLGDYVAVKEQYL